MPNPGKNAKSSLKYAQKNISALPDTDPYKSILLDLYRAGQSLRHLIAVHYNEQEHSYRRKRRTKVVE